MQLIREGDSDIFNTEIPVEETASSEEDIQHEKLDGATLNKNVKVEHENDDRALEVVFNGPFNKILFQNVRIIRTKIDALFKCESSDSAKLFYVLDGSIGINFWKADSEEKFSEFLNKRGRIFLPAEIEHEIAVTKDSILICCSEKPFDDSTDNHEILSDNIKLDLIYNGVEYKQVKVATASRDAELGGHFHEYGELFHLLEGEAEFELCHIETGEKNTHKLKAGERLFIPPKTNHTVSIKKGSILVGCTEEEYISPEHNDKKLD